MSSTDPGNLQSLANPIPLDMIHAWLRGEYLVSQNESTGYELLGWALMLRGAYVYTVQYKEDDYVAHWGICTIDLKDGDLIYQGIRLSVTTAFYQARKQEVDEELNKENWQSKSDKEKKEHRSNRLAVYENEQIWHSIFSKLTRIPTPIDDSPDAYFGYVMYAVDDARRENLNLKNEHKTKLHPLIPPTDTKLDGLVKAIASGVGKEKEDEIAIKAQALRNTELVKYLIDRKFERDKIILAEPQPQGDEVVAIAHINLAEWTPDPKQGRFSRTGHFQPVISSAGQDSRLPQLKKPGTIRFYPLTGSGK